MSITNRLKFWRTSTAKSIGAAAALAVFAGFLTPSASNASVGNDILVVMYPTSVSSADICVTFADGDGLSELVANPVSDYGSSIAVRSSGDAQHIATYISDYGLSLDTENSSYVAGVTSSTFTLTHVLPASGSNYNSLDGFTVDSYSCDIRFTVTNLKIGDWDHINFKYRAYTEQGVAADGVHEGSTYFGVDYTDEWNVGTEAPNISHYWWNSEGSPYGTSVGLANANNDVRDERHTAFFCLSNNEFYDYWDYWYANAADATLRVWDATTEEWVTDSVDISHYSDGDWASNDTFYGGCNGQEQSWLISGLTLGHTYQFTADVLVYEYDFSWGNNDWEDVFDEMYWDTVTSRDFTPLDVRQNQTTVYEQDANMGEDGPFVGAMNGYDAGWYDADVFRGDSLSECGWYSCENGNTVAYTNVDVALPASALDYFDVNSTTGHNLGQAYMDTYGYFDVVDDQGAVDWDGSWNSDSDWKSFAEYNGGQYRDSNGYWSNVYGSANTFGALDWEYKDVTSSSLSFANQVVGPQQTGDGGYYKHFHGQAFVNIENMHYDGDYIDGVWQGLSDTFSTSNYNYDMYWDANSVRATSDTSVELSYTTHMSTDQFHMWGDLDNGADWANAWVNPANATYYVRVVPNYGHNAQFYPFMMGPETVGHWCISDPWCVNVWGNAPGWDNFSGNEVGRPDRFGTIDYVFSNDESVLASNPKARTFTMVGDRYCTWNEGLINGSYRVGCYRNGVAQFNLDGLQPGTTYSVEVRTQAPVVSGQDELRAAWNESDTDSDAASGDGGWINLENRRGYYALATTYLSSAAQNVTRTSADVAVNLQNSHMVDVVDAQQAGYVAVNKCNGDVESEDGPCYNWVSNSNSQAFDGGEGTWYNRFDMTQVSRYPVTRTEFVDGQLSAIVHLTQLTPETQYEVVFAMDYWPTGAQQTYFGWQYNYYVGASEQFTAASFQGSNRKPFVWTLDGTYCNWEWSGAQYEGSIDDADCYNGAQNNNIYRTGVVRFTTNGYLDVTDPTLTSIEPAKDSDAVAVDSDLTLTFSENVSRGSVGHLIKVWNADTASVAYTVDVTSAAVSGSGDTWSVSLPDLNYSTNYYVTVDSGAFVDAAGNTYKGLAGADSKFTTESTDEQGPTLESIATVSTWQDGLADIDTTLTLNFDENVVKGLGNIEIRKSSNSQVVRTIVPAIYKNIAIDGKKVTITLSGLLDYSTEYFVYVAPEAFSDTNGNLYGGNAGEIFNGDKPASFTTQDRPDYLGTVGISGSDTKGWRTYTVNYGPSSAFFAVKLYFRDRHTGVYRYMATVYLDDKGKGSVKLKFLHLMQYDYIMGKVGNHVSSISTVMLP